MLILEYIFFEKKKHNLKKRLKAVSEPFAYEEYRKKKVKDKMDEKRKSRISIRTNLPKV